MSYDFHMCMTDSDMCSLLLQIITVRIGQDPKYGPRLPPIRERLSQVIDEYLRDLHISKETLKEAEASELSFALSASI